MREGARNACWKNIKRRRKSKAPSTELSSLTMPWFDWRAPSRTSGSDRAHIVLGGESGSALI